MHRSRLTQQCGVKIGLPFPAFVERIEELGTDVDAHTARQVDHLMPDGVLAVDFIGRVERMGEDWRRLQAMWPLPPLPTLNSTTQRPSDVDLARALPVVRRIYAADYSAFGYD